MLYDRPHIGCDILFVAEIVEVLCCNFVMSCFLVRFLDKAISTCTVEVITYELTGLTLEFGLLTSQMITSGGTTKSHMGEYRTGAFGVSSLTD